MLAVISQSVSPSVFGLTLSLNLLLAIVLGGLGSLFGAAWGALLLVAAALSHHRGHPRLRAEPGAGEQAGRQPPAGDLRPHVDHRDAGRPRRHPGRASASPGSHDPPPAGEPDDPLSVPIASTIPTEQESHASHRTARHRGRRRVSRWSRPAAACSDEAPSSSGGGDRRERPGCHRHRDHASARTCR